VSRQAAGQPSQVSCEGKLKLFPSGWVYGSPESCKELQKSLVLIAIMASCQKIDAVKNT
jgi:hypothetical protein